MKKILMVAALTASAIASSVAQDAAPAEKTSRWTRKGNASLQFTQGYVSKNWYKGGESNFALLAAADYTFNYKYKKFTWDNFLEGKLGFVTTPSDLYHDYMTNTDLLKYTTKFGYKAGGDWYYTLQGVGQTQFCTGYKSNNAQMFSKFFNPAYMTVSLGMDYKKSKENISWSIFLGPVAYSLKYVSDPIRNFYTDPATGIKQYDGRIDGTQFGVMAGEFNAYDLGASAKGMMEWKICKYVTWTSQASYFSPLYNVGKKDANGRHQGYTNIEWENTFNMPLNKYFSTKIFTHLRFDDSVGRNNYSTGWGYFQFTELLSFGLAYSF